METLGMGTPHRGTDVKGALGLEMFGMEAPGVVACGMGTSGMETLGMGTLGKGTLGMETIGSPRPTRESPHVAAPLSPPPGPPLTPNWWRRGLPFADWLPPPSRTAAVGGAGDRDRGSRSESWGCPGRGDGDEWHVPPAGLRKANPAQLPAESPKNPSRAPNGAGGDPRGDGGPNPTPSQQGRRSAPSPNPFQNPSDTPLEQLGGHQLPPTCVTTTMAAKSDPPAQDGQELKSVVSRVARLTLVSCACGVVTTAYTSTKGSHPYVRSVCHAAEKGVKALTAAAVSGAQPILTKLEPQISTANEYACKGLEKLEEKLPILQQPPGRVVAGTRELVSSTVSGAVGLARGAVQGGVEGTRWALSGVGGSRVGRLLATGVDAVLGKSEELVERYLPGTDEEPAAVAGTEVATAEWQGRRQSCFVRAGTLSAKLRHRALRRSLGELQRARHSARRVLARLHRLFELMEQGRQGMDGPLYGARQHLHRMWLEWSQRDAVPMEESEVEVRTLAMLRGLLRQLHAACTRLAASAWAVPGSVQHTAGHIRHGVEGVQASLAHARSFHDLSGLVLEQSRDTVTRAQLSIDELLEYVGQHAPLPWLVGPFAPALVEYPEDVPVEMAKWEGCITVGGTHRVPAPPQLCSQR
ncbi:perilipin-3-like [Podargus strigoides]